MLYTHLTHEVMISCIFCGEIYRAEAWGRKERTGSKWDVNSENVLLHLHTEHSSQVVLDSLSSGKKKWFVLRQRIVFDHMPHFHPFLLLHWEIQSTPLPPYSSMLTCWNSFKSSTHCFSHLAGDYQHAPWCNTLTKNLLCSICFPDTKIETLQAQWLSFP